MKKNKFDITVYRYIGILIVFLFSVRSYAQQDSALNRSVTVERDFQPVIQAAGKVSTKPAVVETTIEPAPIEYSSFTADVTPSATFHSLLSQPTRFEPSKSYNGYVRGAIGHPNTLFDFGYHLDDGRKSILDVYAHHKAEWGLAALSKTKAGLNFRHPFSTCELYFGVNGSNIYYHKYGHFYDYSQAWGMWEKNSVAYPKPRTIGDIDKTSLWTVEAFLGVRSNPKQEVQYQLQTGYDLFSKPGAVTEHQIRTKGGFDWHGDAHHVGLAAYIQNNFLQLGSLAAVILPAMYNSRHNFRLEPYYAYEGQRVRLHVGVNLDMNIGVGKNALSSTDNISFAPSPHVNLEAQIAREWLTIYADATGHFGLGSLQEYMETNRYRLIHAGIIDHHVAAYTPVDAELGFHIRPARGLLLELHGGYAYMLNQTVLVAHKAAEPYAVIPAVNFMQGDFGYEYADYNRGKIGGQLNYHFRDVLRLNLNGDYYFWAGNMPVYDRANWDLCLRIDGRIDKHWSLYSENRFEGSRTALVSDGTTYQLRPTIDLNAGVQYEMWVGKKAKSEGLKVKADGAQILRPEPKPNLTLFLQLNNWLHRKNEYYYGYRSQGINFLVGAMFRF
jgi:hypothetical protein